jgi:nucleotide-binding universal stress UspA family protein
MTSDGTSEGALEMKTIVVPVDGSELAEQALHLASTIARACDAEVMLTTAISVGERWVDDGYVSQFEAEVSSAVDAYLDSIVERLRGLSVRARAHVEWGRPEVVINGVVRDEAADLVVMTTHGRSGLSRLTLGSVADKLLRTTSAPLLLVHPKAESGIPVAVRMIAVPLDGSQLAEKALPHAERLAAATGASLLLVRAVAPAGGLYADELVPGDLPVLDDMESQALHYLQGIASAVRDRGLTVGVAVDTGAPAEVILRLSKEGDVDLAVMTSHGRSGFNRFVLGSVADEVIRGGDLPVLMVRLADVEPAEMRAELVPVALNTVVPAPELVETPMAASTAAARSAEQWKLRPERSPGR